MKKKDDAVAEGETAERRKKSPTKKPPTKKPAAKKPAAKKSRPKKETVEVSDSIPMPITEVVSSPTEEVTDAEIIAETVIGAAAEPVSVEIEPVAPAMSDEERELAEVYGGELATTAI